MSPLSSLDLDIGAWMPLDAIVEGLTTTGYVVLPAVLPPTITDGLTRSLAASRETLKRAAIGRGDYQQTNSFVRRDKIAWLSPKDPQASLWFQAMEFLRLGLNRELFLGLWDFECQVAHYQPGDFYRRHYDAFRGRSNRRVSVVAYLNGGWLPDQAGELAIYPDMETLEPALKVTPLMGTMVVFLSEDVPHEVLPAERDRYSVAGWFRVNDTLDNRLDPAR